MKEGSRRQAASPAPADPTDFITTALPSLADSPSFGSVIGLVGGPTDSHLSLSDLMRTITRTFVASATQSTAIAFVHALTGPAATRPLLSHVDDPAAARLLAHAWQTGAGVYAVYASEPRRVDPVQDDPADLGDRALRFGDEHAIKFVEVCLREHALDADPLYLVAARRALDLLGGVSA